MTLILADILFKHSQGKLIVYPSAKKEKMDNPSISRYIVMLLPQWLGRRQVAPQRQVDLVIEVHQGFYLHQNEYLAFGSCTGSTW